MFCLPDTWIEVLDERCVWKWKWKWQLTRIRLQMNICRQCFREKSTDIGFNKVRFALSRPPTRDSKMEGLG